MDCRGESSSLRLDAGMADGLLPASELGLDEGAKLLRARADPFHAAVRGEGDTCRNRPEDCLGDLRVAEAITVSAREKRTIALSP